MPITEDGRIVCIKHHRYLGDRVGIEFPGGATWEEEPIEDMTRRELLEETGYVADDIELVRELASNPCLIQTQESIYIAAGVRKSEEDYEIDEEELTEPVLLSVDELDKAIEDGEVKDMNTIAVWYLARPRVIEIIDQIKRKA